MGVQSQVQEQGFTMPGSCRAVDCRAVESTWTVGRATSLWYSPGPLRTSTRACPPAGSLACGRRRGLRVQGGGD